MAPDSFPPSAPTLSLLLAGQSQLARVSYRWFFRLPASVSKETPRRQSAAEPQTSASAAMWRRVLTVQMLPTIIGASQGVSVNSAAAKALEQSQGRLKVRLKQNTGFQSVGPGLAASLGTFWK